VTEFRIIPEWPGYIAGDDGTIWAEDWWGNRKLKPTLEDGYHRMRLKTVDGKIKYRYAHQLVLLAFVGPKPHADSHTRHLDGDPGNNCLENLCYGTAAENADDTRRHGRHRKGVDNFQGQKTHCPQNHEYSPENTKITAKGERLCKACRTEQQRRYDAKRVRNRRVTG
jgi:hypothetical protein